ncbi:MAG: hypothetical protein Athens101410_775, partial [Parcubacteria group bacterium Athens1014_10]
FLKAENPKNAEIYFFWRIGCPHCEHEKLFLEKLKEKYPEIEIKDFEISASAENVELFKKISKTYNENVIGVPATFIGDKAIIGYLNDETSGKEIEAAIINCLEKECSSPSEKLKSETGAKAACKAGKGWIINCPLVGEVDLSKMSLPVLTVVIGLLDGFNPCAMWVLVFLISLLLNTKSRKRMWQVGGIFILASGILYYIFMAAWLNFFLAVSYFNLIRIIVGGLAIGVGVWRIRDFFVYQPGVCKVAESSQTRKQKLVERIKKVVQPTALPATLLGVIVLAFGVNLIELFCSAGLPAIYTQILALSNLNTLSYYGHIFVYTFFFMLDDMIIFAIAIITLSKIGFTDKYNKYSAIFGGILILLIGFLLIFKPEFLMFD